MSIIIPESDLNQPWKLPDALLSEERLKQSQRLQKELAMRINSPFASKSPKDIEMFNASILIKELEAHPKLSKINREYLAESYASVGQFEKAAEVTKNKHNRKRWKGLWNAVMLDDDEKCHCTDAQFGNVLVNNQGVSEDVFSLKHQKVMPAVQCSKCGHMNVTQLPARIASERGHRRTAAARTQGMNPSDAKTQLTNDGHTSKLILNGNP